MKVQKTIEVNQCDFCGKGTCYDKCFGCGKDICMTCKEEVAVSYKQEVMFESGKDPVFCHDCDKEHQPTPLHKALRKIAKLRQEHDDFYEIFKRRSEKAERTVKALLPS